MELDELKGQLNRKIISAQREVSADDIASLLKKRTGSVIQKIRRSLKTELAFTVIFSFGAAFMIFYMEPGPYKTFFSVFLFIGLAFSILIAVLLNKTIRLSSTVLPVRRNLVALIGILKQYTRLYLQLGMALLPACFGFALWLSYSDPSVASKPFRWDVFSYLAVGVVILSVGIFYLTRWYLKQLYGKHISGLEQLLNEFNQE